MIHMILKADDNYSLQKAVQLLSKQVINRPVIITMQDEKRTLKHNAAQWPILQAFADQVKWPINGKMEFIEADDWKDILTAAYKNETVRVASGFDGGMVLLGQRTSKFSAKEWPEWMGFLNFAAAEKGVKIPISKAYYSQLEGKL